MVLVVVVVVVVVVRYIKVDEDGEEDAMGGLYICFLGKTLNSKLLTSGCVIHHCVRVLDHTNLPHGVPAPLIHPLDETQIGVLHH